MADAPNWDDLEPIAGPAQQDNSAPKWEDLEPIAGPSQQAAAAPRWEDLEPIDKDAPRRQEKPPEEEPSALGSAARGVARAAAPTTAGILGGMAGLGVGGELGAEIGAGIGTFVAPGAGTLIGGGIGGLIGAGAGLLGGGALAGGLTREAQDTVSDKLGLDSPESRERDVKAHPYVTTAAEIAPALATLSPGNLSTKLATRLASGAIMGTTDVVNQGITKGFGNIDPTQAAIATAGGAALAGPARPWARGALGAAFPEKTFGPVQAEAKAAEGEVLQPAESGVVRTNGPADDPAIQAALKPGNAPSPGPDVNAGPTQYGPKLDQEFPTRQPEPANPRELFTPRDEFAANSNAPERNPEGVAPVRELSEALRPGSEVRQPDLGGAGDPAMMQRYGSRTRLKIPERLQQWRENNPENYPPLPGVREAAAPEAAAPPEPSPAPPPPAPAGLPPADPLLRERLTKNAEKLGITLSPEELDRRVTQIHLERREAERKAAIAHNVGQTPVPAGGDEIPTFLRRTPAETPKLETKSENFGGREAVGQNENNPPGWGSVSNRTAMASPAENAEIAAMKTEKTAAGQQGVLPGAEQISDAELAQRRANQPLRPKAEQKPMETGLFGETAPQGDMFKSPKLRKSAPKPFQGMIENADQYRQNAKDRTEQGLGTQRIVPSQGDLLRQQGRSVEEANAEYNQHAETFDSALRQAGIGKDEVGPEVRDLAVQRMMRGEDPLEAMDNATADVERAGKAEAETNPELNLAERAKLALKPKGMGAEAAEFHEEPAEYRPSTGGQRLGIVSKSLELLKDNPLTRTLSPQSAHPEGERVEDLFRHWGGNTDQQAAITKGKLDKLEELGNAATPSERWDAVRSLGTPNGLPEGHTLKRYEKVLEPVNKAIERMSKEIDPQDWDAYLLRHGEYSGLWDRSPENLEKLRDFYEYARGEAQRDPTISEALDFGVKLNPHVLAPDGAPNPSKVWATEMANRLNFISTQGVLKESMDHGLLRLKPLPGDQLIPNQTLNGKSLYAEPGLAEVYKNAFGRGFYQTALEPFYDGLLRLKTMQTQGELFGGAFHFITIGKETLLSRAAVATEQAASGDWAGFQKSLKNIPKTFLPKSEGNVFESGSGGKLLNEYMNPGSSKDPIQRTIAKGLINAGLRYKPTSRTTPEYQATRGIQDDLVDSFKKGSDSFKEAIQSGKGVQNLKGEAGEAGNRIKNAFKEGYWPGTKTSVGEVFDGVSRTMQGIMHPLFNWYIPMAKFGVNNEQATAYLINRMRKDGLTEADPQYHKKLEAYLDDGEFKAEMKKTVKSTDDRLGELNNKYIFWNPVMKQSALLSLRAFTWLYGTVRHIGGGALSIAKAPAEAYARGENAAGILKAPLAKMQYGEFHDPRVAYTAVAFPLIVAATNSIYQFLKTGELPKSPRDLVGPRTGGQAGKSGFPERAVLPGYEKDVYGWIGNPAGEAFNKLAGLPRSVLEAGPLNRDWKDDPIRNENGPMVEQFKQFWGHVLSSFVPISAQEAEKKARYGTNLTRGERMVGIRQAPKMIEQPGRNQLASSKFERQWKAKQKNDERLYGR